MYDMAAAARSLLHHGFPIHLKTLSKAQALIQVYWSQLVIHTGSTKSSHFKCNYFVINCPKKPNWCSTQWGPMLFIKGLTKGLLGKKIYNNKNTSRELYSLIIIFSIAWRSYFMETCCAPSLPPFSVILDHTTCLHSNRNGISNSITLQSTCDKSDCVMIFSSFFHMPIHPKTSSEIS